jgi:DNA-binding NtrC family response regulator
MTIAQQTSVLLGSSPIMRSVRDEIENLARFSNVTVLLQGETGTGKEIAARYLHKGSFNGSPIFTVANLATIPESIVERELFGHERGAFSDANMPRPGLVEAAERGTLFFDEISSASERVQGSLLRLLENREYYRLGSTQPRQSTARFIAAANVDLEASVAAGKFRRDLFYRVGEFTITLPPLRTRTEDIPMLARHFVDCFKNSYSQKVDQGIIIEPTTLDWLAKQPWPGNVRQLKNSVDAAVIRCDGQHEKSIQQSHFHLRNTEASGEMALKSVQRTHVLTVYTQCGGNHSKAARTLGVSRTKMYGLLRRLEISKEDLPIALQ